MVCCAAVELAAESFLLTSSPSICAVRRWSWRRNLSFSLLLHRSVLCGGGGWLLNLSFSLLLHRSVLCGGGGWLLCFDD
ncbi:hypothetical protein A2U01_0045599 [Trifolium medium]|uniref:Uncharacterized protein n=1 Tax=Trifolium medium TaxID=97028 RepID=A0A392QLK9_9FABA|nr:hypothetical protein [Trifolium medium]